MGRVVPAAEGRLTVWRVVCAGIAGAVACGHPREIGPAQQRDTAAGLVNALPAPGDAPEVSEDERLAAIQKAMNELRGAGDVTVFGGGIVPKEDLPKLEQIGVAKIFTPGASTNEIVDWVEGYLRPKVA